MKFSTVLTAFAMVALIYSCGGNAGGDSASGDHGAEMASLDVKIDNKIDPVCQMEMKEGMTKDTVHYHESVYGFCSKNCKETFAKTPEDFLDKLGN